jgi:hypothetical protein
MTRAQCGLGLDLVMDFELARSERLRRGDVRL